MKRLFLLFSIAFSGMLQMSVKAQTTLTAANIGYLPGQEFILAQNGANYNFFLSPQTGANQIWNFSTANGSNYDTIRTVSRAQAPFPTSVPKSNVVVYSSNSRYNYHTNYLFLELNSSKITQIAVISYIATNPLNYLETPDLLRFPFSFNSSFIDTATQQYIGANNSTCTYKEIYTVEAVGYGQLITPGATYNQALQVRTTRESLSDNCRPQMYRGFSKDIIYNWYVPGIHIPVYQIAENTVSLGNIYYGYYLHSARLSVKEEQAYYLNLQIFPNPATSEVIIQYLLKSPSKVRLLVTDALGKEILTADQKMQTSGSYSRKFYVRNLPKGVYLVRLETDENIAVKKLVVQ